MAHPTQPDGAIGVDGETRMVPTATGHRAGNLDSSCSTQSPNPEICVALSVDGGRRLKHPPVPPYHGGASGAVGRDFGHGIHSVLR